jgi:hypothetical protein
LYDLSSEVSQRLSRIPTLILAIEYVSQIWRKILLFRPWGNVSPEAIVFVRGLPIKRQNSLPFGFVTLRSRGEERWPSEWAILTWRFPLKTRQ